MYSLYESILSKKDIIKNVEGSSKVSLIMNAFKDYMSSRLYDKIPVVSKQGNTIIIDYKGISTDPNFMCVPSSVLILVSQIGCKTLRLLNFSGSIRMFEDIDLKGITIETSKGIELSSYGYDNIYTLKNCKFTGYIRLVSVNLDSCIIPQGMLMYTKGETLTKCHIEGPVDVSDMKIHMEKEYRDLYDKFKFISKKGTPLISRFEKIKRPIIFPNIEDVLPFKNCKLDCEYIAIMDSPVKNIFNIVYAYDKPDLYVNDAINDSKSKDGEYYVYVEWDGIDEKKLKIYNILKNDYII